MVVFYKLRQQLVRIKTEGEGEMELNGYRGPAAGRGPAGRKVTRMAPAPVNGKTPRPPVMGSGVTRVLTVAVELDRKKRLCRARMDDAMDAETRAYWQGRTSAFQEARDLCEGRLAPQDRGRL